MSCWVGTKGKWTTACPTEKAIGPQTKLPASFLNDPAGLEAEYVGTHTASEEQRARG